MVTNEDRERRGRGKFIKGKRQRVAHGDHSEQCLDGMMQEEGGKWHLVFSAFIMTEGDMDERVKEQLVPVASALGRVAWALTEVRFF